MARTSRGRRSGTLGRTSQRTGTVEFFTRPERNPYLLVLGFVLRHRAEIFVATIVVVVFVQLQMLLTPAPAMGATGPVGPVEETFWSPANIALVIMTASTVVIFVVPPTRRYLVARMWAVLTRHRMRTAFSQTRTMTHNGRMPFLVWSRPSPVGERVRVWLPAGLSVKDLERVTAELAAACWAREVRVTPVRSQAALVVVDIVRHDPLAAGRTLVPAMVDDLDPVFERLHRTRQDRSPVSAGTVLPLPDRSALTSVPTPPASGGAPPAGRPARPRPAAATHNGSSRGENSSDDSGPAVTGFGGVDVSDYV